MLGDAGREHRFPTLDGLWGHSDALEVNLDRASTEAMRVNLAFDRAAAARSTALIRVPGVYLSRLGVAVEL